jgi:hypothetical protein
MRARRSVIGLVLGVVAACGDPSKSVGLFGDAGTGAASTGEDASGTSAAPTNGPGTGVDATGDETSVGSDDEPGIKLDVAGNADLQAGACLEGGECYCSAVDILFVIDNSPSMGPYQEQLAFAFPTFVDAMWSNLPPGTDLHVGITTTSFFTGSCAESTINCMTGQTPQEVLAHYLTPDQGSTGVNGEQGRLFEYDGLRYFASVIGSDPWPLKIWFSEAAVDAGEVGCSYEMMSAGAGYAFHPANAATNAGFLRPDDAVLVIFFLTDEPDKSPEGAQTYADMIAAAKQPCGGLDCVVAAGIVNTCIMNVADPLWAFLQLMPDPPSVGSIDDPASYDDVIGSALASVIAQKCDDIVPEG